MDMSEAKAFLKKRLYCDKTTLYGFDKEKEQINDLFIRTAKNSESNSAILIGPKKSGKSTLLNSVLFDLVQDKVFVSNTLLIYLNGLIHIDDRLALKSTTVQMNLEKEVEGKTFSSFSENLSFLLSCLKTGKDLQRLIFIIDEIDLFCTHHNQTLLYNLFDVAQSAQTPICVLGITSRLDVIELLEKRVKSRFSHRQIFMLPDSENFQGFANIFKSLLLLPSAKESDIISQKFANLPQKVIKQNKIPFLRKHFDPKEFSLSKKCINEWNKMIEQLTSKKKVLNALEILFNTNVSLGPLKRFLYELLSIESNITENDISKLVEHLYFEDDKVKLINGLSVLEICLLISIKHHSEIYDNDPFNFEIILTRYNKFALKSSTMQNIDREVVLKAFENLKYQEFIAAIGHEGKMQKEYQMHKLLIFPDNIERALQKYHNLPTEIEHWSKSCII
ncbi:origin recognition complex subunit 4 [Chironomus tepperi]|uniref:origin recognition complex subunit 4 n=1 Tax=Chironomus tepperi TaxID=113505 RepID=UPI00391F6239